MCPRVTFCSLLCSMSTAAVARRVLASAGVLLLATRTMASTAAEAARPVPTYLLTGYLGAGKTTLLNRLLRESNTRFAVIENEYAMEFAIENELPTQPQPGSSSSGAVKVYEFGDGCVCCSASEEFELALEDVLERRDELKYEAIVIETTGRALAGPVTRILQSPTFAPRLDLSGVITVVDAVHAVRYLDPANPAVEFKEQIHFADTILLNKMDRASSDNVAQLEQAIATLNTHCQVYHTSYCDVDVQQLLRSTRGANQAAGPEDGELLALQHDRSISTTGANLDKPLPSRARFEKWLQEVVTEHHNDLARYKGVIVTRTDSAHVAPNTRGDLAVWTLQGVHEHWELQPRALAPDEPLPMTRLAFIGPNMDRHVIRRRFYESFDPSE